MKITVTLLVAAMAGLAPGLAGAAETTAPGEPGSGTYDVIWNSPSKNALGSMPIGNGDIGANVWVEPSGDLVLLISKTDAYDEFERLLKLGRIRIKTTPSLVQTGKTFQQKLSLQDGAIEILCGTTTARVWVDANHPVIQVDLQNPTPMEAQVTLETWRTAPRALDRRSGKEQEGHSCNYAGAKKRVNPDIILPHCAAQLAWCHHNIESQWKYMLELTGLGDQIPVDAAPTAR